ncbi:hypothetical protein QTP88_011845 [Uroleucon formosanum]
MRLIAREHRPNPPPSTSTGTGNFTQYRLLLCSTQFEVLQQSRQQNSGTAVTQRTNHESFPSAIICPNDSPPLKIHRSGLGRVNSEAATLNYQCIVPKAQLV